MRLIISCGFNRFGQLSGTDTQWEYRDKDEHLMLPPCVMSKVTDIITATWMHTLVIVSIVDEAGNQQQMLQLYGDNAAESILSSDILENTTLPVKYGKLLSTGQYLQLDGADNLIMTHYLPSELKDYRVQLGQYQSVAVSDEGQIAMIKDKLLYTNQNTNWLKSIDATNPADSLFNSLKVLCNLKPKFTQIVSGHAHWLALANDGQLYSWGSNRFGQLGHGDTQDRFEPQVIEALQGIKVIEIACGAFHSAIITEFKDLYTFGWDNYGQLGLSIEQKLDPGYPNCIEFPVETSIQSVACGEGHTIVALDDNTVWSCGWNKYGQLGHSLDSTQSKWQLINLPINKTFTIDRCICGPWNTFIVVNTDQDKL